MTYLITFCSTSASRCLAKKVRISQHPVGPNTGLSARMLAHTLFNPLVCPRLSPLLLSATGDMTRKARTLVNPSQPAYPGLILLTFAVTCHLAARCCNTHSLTHSQRAPRWKRASVLPAAQDAGFGTTWCHTAENYGWLFPRITDILGQAFMQQLYEVG